MSAHTPGPWKVDFKKFNQVKAENGALIAECRTLNGMVNLQANARLIAAAPELLEMLKKFVAYENAMEANDDVLGMTLYFECSELARVAIAKATEVQA